MTTLNYIDTHVKASLLFSQFEHSRIHVLEHMLLTNGNAMRWAQHPDTGLYMVAHEATIRDGVWTGQEVDYLLEALSQTTAPHVTDLDTHLASRFMNARAGKSLDNTVHHWLFEHIDEVCQASFYAGNFNLAPKTLPMQYSRNYSLLGTMPDAAQICPMMLSAIDELCDSLLTRLSQFDHEANHLSNDVLHRLRQNWRGYSELYLAIMHAKAAIDTATQKAEKDAALLAEILGTQEEQYAQSGLADTLSFEAYQAAEQAYEGLPASMRRHHSLTHFIQQERAVRDRYFTDGTENAAFLAAAQAEFETLSFRYFDINSLTSQLARALKLPRWHHHRAELFVRDNLPLLIPAS